MTTEGITTPVNLRMPVDLFQKVESLRIKSKEKKTKTDIVLELLQLGVEVVDRYAQMKSPEAIELLNQKMDTTEIVDIMDRLDERTFRAIVAAVSDAKAIREARARKALHFRGDFA
jgi:hypothetical protein